MRDYIGDMRKILESETAEGGYSPARLADDIFNKLAIADPDLLHGFLLAQGPQTLRQEINLRDGARRSRARHAAQRFQFRQAVQSAEAGDRRPLTQFLSTVYTTENGLRIKLSDMYSPDLAFVAVGYEQRASTNAMQAAFFRALADRVGSEKVSDVFDEKTILDLWVSLRT